MQPCCRPRKLEPGTRPLRSSSASRSSFGGRAIRLGLRVAGHHVVDVFPRLSSIMLFRQQQACISQLANDDVSDSGVWVDPTLLRKRLISWDRPDFFDLGTPPMRSTAGYPFSSDCFRLHISLAAKMFQLKETCPRFSRESRFTQGHFMCLFKTRKKPGPPVSISALTWQREEPISRPPWER